MAPAAQQDTRNGVPQGLRPGTRRLCQRLRRKVAGCLRSPHVPGGFLPATDERVVNTIEAVHRELTENGFVRRYRGETDDGFPEGEATFLVCTGWLADNLALMGREWEARDLYEGLLDVRNDVGLLAEEYDPVARRQLGNFPQAFSHVGIINTANNLAKREGGSHGRSRH